MERADEHEARHPDEDKQRDDAAPEGIPAAVQAAASPLAVVPEPPAQIARTLRDEYRPALGRDGRAYLVERDSPNTRAHQLGTRACNALLGELLRQAGAAGTPFEVRELTAAAIAYAEMYLPAENVWYRYAESVGGVEIALYDDADTRVRITPGRVEVVTSGSPVAFYRTPHCRPMATPAAKGDVGLLKQYLNFDDVQFTLYVGYLTYTMAHPKVPASKFPLLVLLGGQGSAKSTAAQTTLRLVDPTAIGVQRFPGSARDLAIAAQGAHVLAYDNLRKIHPSMSDALCTASTGGSFVTRQLYTNAEQVIMPLHAAVILNGIFGGFMSQPDLAQRSLVFHLRPIDERHRQSESELARRFETDLPAIQRGLFDKVAAILEHVESAEVTTPERMYDFCRWLAAMERADGVPPDMYQAAYSTLLYEAQLDSVMDSLLGATVLEFAEKQREWAGTPAELHGELGKLVSVSAERSRDWPSNPISMSRRLAVLVPALLTQGVQVEFTRGRERRITITRTKEAK
jgi:hypothetical protein